MSSIMNMFFGKRLAFFASPMDPCPTVGHVRAFEAVMQDPALACDGIMVAVAEKYLPANPPIIPYNTLSDRVELVRALRYVDSVTTYRSQDELYDILCSTRPAYRIMRVDEPDPFADTDLAQYGIQIIQRPELTDRNYRVDLIERIQRGQH